LGTSVIHAVCLEKLMILEKPAADAIRLQNAFQAEHTMSEKIGRFEIISQLAQSPFATIYKAVDGETQQTVALKVVRLDQVQDRDALIKRVCDEAESAKPLSSHNIATLYGVGDENDLLMAATEYVQGNSAATTLARHDGFSIWDIQDIARQVCQALDHAHAHKAGHQSLEPAKIMVGWDGIVKVLGFGISTMNATAANASTGVPEILHYASPEQVRGEACDHRSTLFSLGAVLYEMATEHKPFTGETAEQLRQAILEQTPALPVRLKPNVNRGLNDLIMKALSKSPEERYQSGQELIRDLENCKSGATAPSLPAAVVTPKVAAKAQGAAASAGASGISAAASSPKTSLPRMNASAAPAAQQEKPAFAVDPMMAGEGEASAPAKASFSDIAELPQLKEVRISMPEPKQEDPEESEPAALKPESVYRHVQIEKPKNELKEVAQKAVAEMRKVPPRLVLYAVGGAVAVVLLIVAGVSLRNYFADRDERGNVSVHPAAAPEEAVKPPVPATEAAAPPSTEAQTAQQAEQLEAAETEAPAPGSPAHGPRRSKARAAAAVVPAQLTVDSTPEGAEIAFDGSALCQSPCTLTGIAPGAHTLSASKAGFSGAARNVSLTAGANATVALQLETLAAVLSVSSNPAGAVIVIDGKDSGKLTPSQFSFTAPGAHTITLRRFGYLEASSSTNVEAGKSANVTLSLTALGSTDEIHAAGGKFSKVFKKGDAAGMATVSIKTQPKGAQIMVNNRTLDKTSPFDFYLNPGTYVIDVTMAGYRPVHRVVTLQEGEKTAIQETLAPE
jgi:serine/threonine protein kinase